MKYNFFNIAAAITIGDYFGVSKENIKKSIENYVPSNNRSQLVNTTHNKVILDAYNANPTSMKAALESFNNVVASNKTIILGDMFELGNYSDKEHQAIVELSSSLQLDNLFFIGEKFYKTVTKHHKFINVKMFKTYLLNNPLKENLILIKGSRGMALEQLVEFC